jgi:hypothetical protein
LLATDMESFDDKFDEKNEKDERELETVGI